MSLGIWIALGLAGGLGAGARYVVEHAFILHRPEHLPLGTALVNLSGAALIGLLAGLGAHGATRAILATGLLGGYTTFSGWMREVRDDRRPLLVLAAPLLLGLLCVWLGKLAGQAL